jgi:hypothetical protein
MKPNVFMGFLLAGFEVLIKRTRCTKDDGLPLNLRGVAGFIEILRSLKQLHGVFADKYCT